MNAPKPPAPDRQQLLELIDATVDGFHGNLNDLSSAVGMLMVGHRYGWRVMLLTHSQATVRKYLRILGLKHLRDTLPEVGDLAHRSNAWRLVDGTANFWKVVRGQIAGVRSSQVDRRSD